MTPNVATAAAMIRVRLTWSASRAMGNARTDAVAGGGGPAVNEYVANAARKRYGYIVQPVRVISWDHSKLDTPSWGSAAL